jgi:hypothetical protein
MPTRTFVYMLKRLAESLHLTKGAVALLMCSAGLLVLWSFVVPIFEAPDEPAHWDYARYVRLNKKLPFYSPFSVEANSPPLYYLIAAPFANYSDIPPRLTWPAATGSVTPALPRYFQNSYSDYVLYWPIRAVRLVTALISLVTIVFCYAAGVEATGRETTGLLGAGLVAFLPQFTFRGMNVSNDAMVTAFSSIVLYVIIRMIRRGASGRLAIACAVMIAAAFLSKASALFLPIPFVVAVVTETASWKQKRKWLSALLISGALAAPWLIRNQILYGDPLAKKAMYTAVGNLINEKSITSQYFVRVFPENLAASFIGVFGWGTLLSPRWVYHIYWLLGGLGILGFIYGLIRGKFGIRLASVLVLIPLLALLVVIEINLIFDQAQGRYMFPALPAMAVAVAIGFGNLPHWPGNLSRGLVVALGALNVYVLLRVVLPAYWPPPNMSFPGDVKILASTQSGRPADEFTLPNDNPEFLIKTDVPTDQYNFFTFTLRGSPDRGMVTGALYLEFCSGESEQHKIPFNWVCDGSVHGVIVPLWTYPDWGGRLAAIRIEPFETPADRYSGLSVQIGSIVIVSSITSTHGP